MEQSEFAHRILFKINELRANPKSLIPLLKQHLSHFDGNVLSVPDKLPIELQEGPAAVSISTFLTCVEVQRRHRAPQDDHREAVAA